LKKLTVLLQFKNMGFDYESSRFEWSDISKYSFCIFACSMQEIMRIIKKMIKNSVITLDKIQQILMLSLSDIIIVALDILI